MHVGLSITFQNLDDSRTDAEIYRHEMSMADSAEPMGFDSIWTSEHHFDGYHMCPSVNQFLTYLAGRTSRVQLGSMVHILPWHDPIRVAEEVAVLDHFSNGRTILGVGRGLGRIEFEGFQRPMGESRERFVAYSEAILRALETGTLYSDSEIYKQPKIAIRPKPLKSFKGRTYAAAVSPESAKIMAQLGIGILVIAQKPWEKTLAELDSYRKIYREINGTEAPKPIIALWADVHEDEKTAEAMHAKWTKAYSRSALNHYEFHNKGLADIKGYEYYGALAKNIEKHGVESFVDFLANLQVRGTPNQVFDKICEYSSMLDAGGVIVNLSHGGMPFEEAKRQMDLFANKVLPQLKSHAVATAAE